MLISTKQKIALARLAYAAVIGLRRLAGSGETAEVVRRGIRWSLDLREGIDLSIYLFGRFEPATVAAYSAFLSPGDIVVDAGANMGAHTLNLARCVGPRGRVLAFEPTVGAFARLQRNIALNPDLAASIVARQAMLVSEPGQAVEPSAYASWRIDGASSPDSHPLHLGTPISTLGAVGTTLDAATKDQRPVKLIKLDVDGHELEVLGGAKELLHRDHPLIVMELAPYTMAERGQDPRKLYELLRDAGYRFLDLKQRQIDDDEGRLPEIPAGSGVNVIARANVPA